MKASAEEYYRERAGEYDAIYRRPERQSDLTRLHSWVADMFVGRDVLEIAAGSGYWTQFIAPAAHSVVATDINKTTLDVARARTEWSASVAFRVGDAHALDDVLGTFDAAFAGFFWSHVAVEQLDDFLARLRRRLTPGARLVFVDNRYVEGSSTPIARTDGHGNTFQTRTLSDGRTWDVCKNFPPATEVRNRLSAIGTEIAVHELQYFWLADLRLGS